MISERLRLGWGLLRAGLLMARLKPSGRRTVGDLIEELSIRYADRPALLYEDRRLTFAEVNDAANRVAHWAQSRGLGKGDVVALLMLNRPEYPSVWAGLAKLGIVTALINTHLVDRALSHALKVSGAKHLIVGTECLRSLEALTEGPTLEISAYPEFGAKEAYPLPQGVENLRTTLAGLPDSNPDRALRRELRMGDDLFYIYTSGTTGSPKAARYSHLRFFMVGGVGRVLGYGPDDVMYCPLPLYHTAGGVMALGGAWASGVPIALRRRFSASQFWDDIRRYDVTAFQYIGEFCRYLLNQPPTPRDGEHRLRFAIGNGLRPDIWEEFQSRFKIPQIVEFYGATEGNAALLNFTNEVGSVGKMPPRYYSNIRHILYDVETDRHPRNAAGFCIECKPGEVGELIGGIPKKKDAVQGRFEGYTSLEDTEKKVLRGVFKPDDAWFRSGDLLRCDARGYFYFVDRIGDTFRWKGENISTQEVAEHLTRYPGVEFATVYGVEVPGADGRAGMAALVLEDPDAFDPASFHDFVLAGLPGYAAPIFLRIQRDLEVTGTFKPRKVELQRAGFDPAGIEEPLYLRHEGARAYLPLTLDRHQALLSGQIRL